MCIKYIECIIMVVFLLNVLSNIATEAFVKERLLPLMPPEQSLLQKNLKTVIENAERQLGRRYL
ncbi:MAG TPA: hypothetical protein DIW17_07035 [Clostridiales bacterium]|nr:hypothetical protein [Clostridiales bacterium]